MHEANDFTTVQRKFAAHIRNPEANPAPAGIEDRRLAIYRELFFNNIEDFLSNGFPVLHSLYEEQQWLEMARSFYAQHACKTPYFLQIAQEFIDYLNNEHEKRACDPDFMYELAHYEWVEIALAAADQEVDCSNIDTDGDLMNGRPVISPLAWLLTYQYPVQHISPDYRPDKPPAEPTCIIAWRDAAYDIHFTEVNTVTARLLQLIEHDKLTSLAALELIAEELPQIDRDTIVSNGLQILRELHEQGIILGTG